MSASFSKLSLPFVYFVVGFFFVVVFFNCTLPQGCESNLKPTVVKAIQDKSLLLIQLVLYKTF